MLPFLKPVYALESDLFKIHFNIILLLTSSSFKRSLPYMFHIYSFLDLPYLSITAQCPVCLSFLHFITLILQGHYFI
jgi:hypothetical protein